MEMTISQALRAAARLKGQIKEHLEHAAASNVWETDHAPAFNFADELIAADKATIELVSIEAAIRVANATTVVDYDGRSVTLSEATARLREMKGQIAWLKALPARAQEETSESVLEYDDDMKRRTVVKKYSCALPQAKIAAAVAVEKEKFEKLNDLVETANHRSTVKV